MDRQNIKSLDHDALVHALAEWGEPKFRVKQIEQWLWHHGASDFEDMTNLSKRLREALAERYFIPTSRITARQVSEDGTRKYLMSFEDGTSVETVGIPSADETRLTVCFSTQAGCAMGCVFCATGHAGFARNLQSYEMFDQVKLVGDDFGKRVSNVVAMGQGEPFANYDELIAALHLMNDEKFLNIGARHITVSTCGILQGIEQFALEPEQFTLAISLHSAIQETRDLLMPGIRSHTLAELNETLKRYAERTGRRPTLEYAPIDGVNDDDTHLDALIAFCRGMLCHVNLIPLNPITSESDPYCMHPSPRIGQFERSLNAHGIETTIRSSRGADIDGACGQLKQRHKRMKQPGK